MLYWTENLSKTFAAVPAVYRAAHPWVSGGERARSARAEHMPIVAGVDKQKKINNSIPLQTLTTIKQ